jgi:hypothetical protein
MPCCSYIIMSYFTLFVLFFRVMILLILLIFPVLSQKSKKFKLRNIRIASNIYTIPSVNPINHHTIRSSNSSIMSSHPALCLILFIALVTSQIQTDAFSCIPVRPLTVSKPSTDQMHFVHTMSARLNDEDENVNVFEVKDVDAVNLTVIGFGKYA